MKRTNYIVLGFIASVVFYASNIFANPCAEAINDAIFRESIPNSVFTNLEFLEGIQSPKTEQFEQGIRSVKQSEVMDIQSRQQRWETIQENKSNGKDYSKRLMKAIRERAIPEQHLRNIEVALNSINDPVIHKDWLRSIHHEAIKETFRSGNRTEILNLETTGRISEKFLLQALIRRLKEAGFSGETVTLNTGVPEAEFAQHLRDGKLIIDNAFKGGSHGHLIHILQIDLWVFSLKKIGEPISGVASSYKWMGTLEPIQLSDGQFKAISDGWFGIFDPTDGTVGQPERANTHFERFLDIKE